jgi:hypothetical protein
MCSACAAAAVAGVSGARSFLQTRQWTWLTPRRLKRATAGLVVAGLAVSTIGFSGSTSPPAGHPSAQARVATSR